MWRTNYRNYLAGEEGYSLAEIDWVIGRLEAELADVPRVSAEIESLLDNLSYESWMFFHDKFFPRGLVDKAV